MAIKRGLGGITHEPTRMAVSNRCFTDGSFGDVAGQAQVNTTVTITYCIDGKMLAVTTADTPIVGLNEDGSQPTAQTAATRCYYVLALNAGGTLFGFKSAEEVAVTATPTRYPYLPDRLELTSGTYTAMALCPVCLMDVNSAAAWTVGTGATNTPTITYSALSTLPAAV